MPKKLIITADDYGEREDINERIIECYLKGAISDISILAVGYAFSHAAELAQKHNIRNIGAHLALTGPFKPLTRGIEFPGSYGEFFAKYFSGRISKDRIYEEFKQQIARIRNAGFAITHVNSHQHVHTVPGILAIVLKIMKEENISSLRFPLENMSFFSKVQDPPAGGRNILLSSICLSSRGLLERSGVRHNDYFIGHARALRLKRADFISAVSGLEEGLTELGCHLKDDEEARALCDKVFMDAIKKHNIELVPY